MAKTPSEIFEKESQELAKSMNQSSKDISKESHAIVKSLSEFNMNAAKVLQDNLKEDQDTWRGRRALNAKRMAAAEFENSEMAKNAAAAINTQKKSIIEQESINKRIKELKDSEEAFRKSQEDALKENLATEAQENMRYKKELKDKADIVAQIKKIEEEELSSKGYSLRNEKGQIMSQDQINTRKEELGIELNKQDAKLQKQEELINASLIATHKDNVKVREKEVEDLENRNTSIQEEYDNAVEIESTANEMLEKSLNEAGDRVNKNYDDFTGGLKTLTGGIIDIATPLDAVAEKWNALKKVTGATQEFFTRNNKREEIRGQKIDQFTELTDENVGTMEDVSDDLQIVTGGIGVALGMIALGILAPIIAIIATIAAISLAVKEESFAGVGQAIKTFATKFGNVLTKGKDLISKGVTRLEKLNPFKAVDDVVPPKGPLKADGTPDKRFKANKGTDVVDDALKGTGNVVDDVAKGGGGIFGALKGAAKTLVKKLPFIGAAADTVLDGMDNIKDIDELRKAREDGTLQKTVVGEDGTETKRDYTDEEFAELEVAFKNNMAGSAGKGVGSFAGGATGAIAGAKLGAMLGTVGGPLGMAVGGFLGTLVGGVAGAVMGGKAGDKVATELSEEVLGGDGSEAIIAEALGNIDKPSGTAIGDGTTELNSEKEQATAVVVANTNVVNDNSSSSSSTSVMSGQTTQDNSTGSRLASQTE